MFSTVLVAPGRELLHSEIELDETFVGGKDPDRDGRGGELLPEHWTTGMLGFPPTEENQHEEEQIYR